ncbi:MAG TPA: inorganic phosphate transporter [Hyphomicrobiales bacterium]|nr:inorganic phosphate transporter [Hyphomicrobiales bacterium]
MSATQRFDSLNLLFGVLLFATVAWFVLWGLNYVSHSSVLIFLLATAFGVFMAFNIGGNDVANSFGTSVGAGTLTMKQALLVAAVFEVSGAVIAGGEVTHTIRSNIVNLGDFDGDPSQFVFIMMSALLAAAVWLLLASRNGYPVSTTHSIVGAIVGGAMTLGFIRGGAGSMTALVQWEVIGRIAISWVISPVLGGLGSYLLFRLIKRHILLYNEEAERQLDLLQEERRAHHALHVRAFERLSQIEQEAYSTTVQPELWDHEEEHFGYRSADHDYFKGLAELEEKRKSLRMHWALEVWTPLLASFGATIIAAMLLFKGLKNLELGFSPVTNLLILGMVGVLVWMCTLVFAKLTRGYPLSRATFLLFSWMQVFTACGFAFSHGSSDISNAVGPFAAVLDVLATGSVSVTAALPTPVMVAFGVALVAGLWFIGREVIMTVGHHLTELHPASGFAAELSAASLVLLASVWGIPVSSTHILIGAVLGIGLVNRHTNWALMKPIVLAWVITLPVAAALSSVFFLVLRQLL